MGHWTPDQPWSPQIPDPEPSVPWALNYMDKRFLRSIRVTSKDSDAIQVGSSTQVHVCKAPKDSKTVEERVWTTTPPPQDEEEGS